MMDWQDRDDEITGMPGEEAELFEHHRFVVDKGQVVTRVDKYLVDRLPNTSRNRIQQAAAAGSILVNGKVAKSNQKVKPLDEVSVVMSAPPAFFEMKAEPMDLNIVYEDDSVILLNKPAGIVVHPGFGNFSGTLVQGLMYHLENLPTPEGAEFRPGMVHRIDKETSGLMIFAKTDQALAHLAKQFFHHTIERRYQAIVWGDVKEDSGTITGHIARSKQDRKVFTVFPEEEGIGKHAITHYKVLKRYGYVTLCEFKLETGRTHQIRVHTRHIGHPIFNDSNYGGDKILRGTLFNKYKQFVENCFETISRTSLHAKSLGFEHPVTKEFMYFESELPEDFQNVLKRWDGYIQAKGYTDEEGNLIR